MKGYQKFNKRSIITNNKKDKLTQGAAIIKAYAQKVGNHCGVYRMLDENRQVLYVGKAKNLAKRVMNYTNVAKLPMRLQRMVFQTKTMEFVRTDSEIEALLLELNLIKSLAPKYNVLLRDDKSFSYIVFDSHRFSRINKMRSQQYNNQIANKQINNDKVYGPFVTVKAIDNTINAILDIFKLRTCTTHEFKQRTKPCLKYHIKKCCAPCVGYVDNQEYSERVAQAVQVLQGKDEVVRNHLVTLMQQASDIQEYEKAAIYRNRISSLTKVQALQKINCSQIKETFHVIGLYSDNGRYCIQVFFYQNGMNYGNKAFYPDNCDESITDEQVLAQFLKLFYINIEMPAMILLSHQLDSLDMGELKLLATERYKIKNINITQPMIGEKKKILDYCRYNAEINLRQNQHLPYATLFTQLQKILDLPRPINYIEVYDNSHIMGSHGIAAMIAVNENGFHKNGYRRFNISSDVIKGGDDYAMMRYIISKRFHCDYSQTMNAVDLLIIDGGKGQLSSVMQAFAQLKITNIPMVIAISKGPHRNKGQETIHIPSPSYGHNSNVSSIKLDNHPHVLHFLQNIRDEAHRYAISGHRKRRDKEMTSSKIDDIIGIGPVRKKILLNHFGTLDAISSASISDIAAIKGISQSIAKIIYDFLRQ